MEAPKIFISYSWSPEENKKKVLELARRLSADGIHVILDVWDLKEGQDKFQFMEQMVNNSDVNKVLLISNKDYAEKANQKRGGVGVESLIVSDEIYRQVKQEKFIPVLMEYDEYGKEYLPIFCKSRIYINFSDESNFENEYEKLVRNIYNKPLFARPPIGTPPAFINDDEPVFIRTAHKVKLIKNALLQNKANVQVLINDYYDTFLESIYDFNIKIEEIDDPKDIDELFLIKIQGMKYLRDDFISFLYVLAKYSNNINLESLHRFFEKLLSHSENKEVNNYLLNRDIEYEDDHVIFFTHEIFLYTSTIFIKEERFKELAYLLHNPFLMQSSRELIPVSYSYFCRNISVLDYRNKKLNLRRTNLFADKLKDRATFEKIQFSDIREADVILYYISCLTKAKSKKKSIGYQHSFWFPYTTVYNTYTILSTQRIISKRFFERYKMILGVESKEQLISLVEYIKAEKIGKMNEFYYSFPSVDEAFKISEVGKID